MPIRQKNVGSSSNVGTILIQTEPGTITANSLKGVILPAEFVDILALGLNISAINGGSSPNVKVHVYDTFGAAQTMFVTGKGVLRKTTTAQLTGQGNFVEEYAPGTVRLNGVNQSAASQGAALTKKTVAFAIGAVIAGSPTDVTGVIVWALCRVWSDKDN